MHYPSHSRCFVHQTRKVSRSNLQTWKADSGLDRMPGAPTSRGSQQGRTSSPQINTPVYTCSKASRMNINNNCSGSRRGAECRCYAAPATLNYYFTGGCGPGRIELKRDLAQQRHSYYHNLTTQYASAKSSNFTVSSLSSQFASGLIPSPCNASYVSFAYRDSVNGIVHEPEENWLGVILDENATGIPPMPEDFYRVHHVGIGNG